MLKIAGLVGNVTHLFFLLEVASLELLSNLVYRVSSGASVWLIRCPYTVFENDTFYNFANKVETLDTLPAVLPTHWTTGWRK